MILGIPPPPDWVESFSARFFQHALEPMYWLLAVTHLLIWWVLFWQRSASETAPARWLRRFVAVKIFLWLTLALTRHYMLWRQPTYVVVTVLIAVTSLALIVAMLRSYVWGSLRGRGQPPPLEGSVVPHAETWDGAERRKAERRKGWPPPASPA